MKSLPATLLQGNEACALAGIDAGATFFAGYPISPATEIAELCSRLLPRKGGVYVQMEDEIASLAAVIGASLSGVKAFTATSGPGLSLMQENIGFACMAEVPCVIINVQRFGPATGVATAPAQADVMAVRWGSHGDYSLVALAPASVQECYNLTLKAFDLAERFRVPVVVLLDATIAHLREMVYLPQPGKLAPATRSQPDGPVQGYAPYAPNKQGVPAPPNFGDRHILRVTGLVHDQMGYSSADPLVASTLVNRLIDKVENYTPEMPAPLYFGAEEPEILIIAFGITSRAAREAVSRDGSLSGYRAGVLQLQTLWPFPGAQVKQLAANSASIIVAELSRGQLSGLVTSCGVPDEKITRVTSTDIRVLTPGVILQAIREEGLKLQR